MTTRLASAAPRRCRRSRGFIRGLLAVVSLAACGDDATGPQERNEAPLLIAGISNQIVPDSLALGLSDYFDDPDGDALRFSAESSDTAVARTLVRTDTAWIFAVVSGSARIVVTGTDPEGLAASLRFEVTVPNRPPRVVDTLPDVEAVVGDSVGADVSPYFADPDRDPLAFSVASSDSAVATAAVVGDSVRVVPGAPGRATITVTAADPDGLTVEQGFSITVPNRAPFATDTLPGVEVEVGDSAVADLSGHFADPDGEALTYGAVPSDSAVAGVAVAGHNLTLTAIARGMSTITVTATDPGGLAVSQAFGVTVPNRPPRGVDLLPDRALHVGDSTTFDAARFFKDPDGDSLAFSVESSDSARVVAGVRGAGGAGGGGAAIMLRAVTQGSAAITVTAADPEGLAATQTFRVTVPNRSPQRVGTIPDIALPVGDTATVGASRYFADPDGDSLAITAQSSDSTRVVAEVPAGGGAGGGGAVVTLRAVAKGGATITVTAADPEGLAATRTFRVTVPNRPPGAVGRIPHLELEPGEQATIDASSYFTDPDGDSLAFLARSSDSTQVVAEVSRAGSGTAIVTISAVRKGSATITVTATDPEGLYATQTFRVVVPNRAPRATSRIADRQAAPGSTLTVHLADHFTDPDGDSLAFTASSSFPAVATATLSGTTLSVQVLATGTTRITVTATDTGGLTARQSFTVRAPNRAPRPVGALPDIDLVAGGEIEFDVSGHFIDPEGDALTFMASSSDTSVAIATASGNVVTVAGIATGTTTITVTATDPRGRSATHTLSATVVEPHTNLPPSPEGTIPDVQLQLGATSTIVASAYFTDPEGDPLTYAASSSDTSVATAAASGDVITVTAVAAGTATMVVTASDTDGRSAAQVFSAAVTEPTAANRPPSSSSTMPDAHLETGSTWTVDASRHFTDPDGDALDFGAASSNTGVATATVSGTTITVTGIAVGTATVTVTATDPGGLFARRSLAAHVRDPPDGDGFEIDLIFTDAVPATYRPALEAAAAEWMAILADTEWPDVTISGTRSCYNVDVDLGVVDDVAILVHALEMDGVGGTVARAGGCIARDEPGAAPILGGIRFDLVDFDLLVDNSALTKVMLHEIVHILGFGPRWLSLNLLDQETDPHFTGPRAIAAFDSAGGTGYAGAKVPTQPGQGHWRESVFGRELMSPRLTLGAPDPLSLITLEALVDMGFAVDLSAADAYTLPGQIPPPAADAVHRTIDLRHDIDRGPVLIVDRNGRTIRVVRPPS